MKNKRNLRLLFAIAFLQGMVFYAPIASLYRQAAGLTLAQISLIEGISYILTLAMELPWGMLADRIGYRKTMIACCMFYFLSKLVFWRADGFSAFLVERFLLSIALAGLSGVDESILYLSCEPAESQRAFGRWEACGTAGMIFASAFYMLFIGSRYRFAALLTMAAYAAAVLLCIGLKEVHVPEKRRQPTIAGFVSLLKQILRNSRLLLFIAGFALFQEAAQMVAVWLNQNQYLRCGMNLSAMGLVHILINIAMLLGTCSSHISARLGMRRFTLLVLPLAALFCVLLCVIRSALLSVLCIAAVAAIRALMLPLVNTLRSRSVSSADRATQLSIFSLLQNFTAAGAQVIYGRMANLSLNAAFIACAAGCLVSCMALLPLLNRQIKEV